MVTKTNEKESEGVLSTPGLLSLGVSDIPLLDEWTSVRDSHIDPLFVSTLNDSEQTREEFAAGARLLGYTEVHPQQLMVASVIGSGEETVVIEMPRRSSKSTSIVCVLLGRALLRPRYKITYTAQSGTKSSEFFRDWVAELDLAHMDVPDSERPYIPRLGNGNMQLAFRNGSVFRVLSQPSAKALRGGAADVVWIDEGQVFNADESAELKAGALPLMDTRDDAQLILSGTAGKARSGWFWDTLEVGRKGGAGVSILEYAADPSTTFEDINDEGVWLSSHPGIGTLTTIEKMRSRREAFGDPEWAAEYLGLWPEDYSQAVFPAADWAAAEVSLEDYPKDVAFGYDISPNGSTAAIVAAWRVDDVAYVELVAHQQGSSWVRPRIVELAKKYKAPVGLNDIGGVRAVREEIGRMRALPISRITSVAYRDIAPACSTLLRDFEDGRLKHSGHVGLTDAILQVGRAQMGDKAWKWMPWVKGADITPVWAATMALRAFDERPKTTRLKAIVA